MADRPFRCESCAGTVLTAHSRRCSRPCCRDRGGSRVRVRDQAHGRQALSLATTASSGKCGLAPPSKRFERTRGTSPLAAQPNVMPRKEITLDTTLVLGYPLRKSIST